MGNFFEGFVSCLNYKSNSWLQAGHFPLSWPVCPWRPLRALAVDSWAPRGTWSTSGCRMMSSCQKNKGESKSIVVYSNLLNMLLSVQILQKKGGGEGEWRQGRGSIKSISKMPPWGQSVLILQYYIKQLNEYWKSKATFIHIKIEVTFMVEFNLTDFYSQMSTWSFII